MDELPVVVVGAGPIGLAAAAHLAERGFEPLVLEAASEVGASVREWGHVRLFSRWAELIDPAAARLLEARGWQRPDAAVYPTGADWASEYLEPLATALGDRVRLGARVAGVARQGRDRVVDAGRDTEPLTVHVTTAGGEERITARAVIDASGTWGSPNPLGGDGLPALGERAARERITYQVPDFTDEQVRARFAGKRVVIAGSGHSALTALVGLAHVAEETPGTEIVWVLRRGTPGNIFGGGEADQLPARGALGLRARQAAEAGCVRTVTGFRTASVEPDGDGRLVLTSFDGHRTDPVDEVVVLTGFRPDLSWLSEIRLELDPVLQAPVALAPLIDPNVHSCGTVYPHGAKELSHPEPGVFLVGMKSYGRAPTFLAMTGYEQVRSVVAAIAGDTEAAERVELALPETGVCGGAGLFDEPEAEKGGCCAAPEVIGLTAPPSRAG
ncbi:Pyridine nucleotide-disulphide oxidoreductase [Saccharopolyspora antimicrobica]|uniref:Pyridine nucleotide-disulfide oxidoreductase n=1 Tax=Saccharopolyspora antimicrobica TaxID=455193 RepID=A0A1I5FJL3_9PSEU|nr:FAD-dependent oxidoreductase [Saccharopolyspora antimicrobica]RKT82187.1 pyridine nucleotide-disulfide oxidoreductase [Saccharopolyspora antimicrobica]SFO23833.1 Pyridine nucleotide-disulphide oxidoreductase [Saccharopolyspora antimicrobica]